MTPIYEDLETSVVLDTACGSSLFVLGLQNPIGLQVVPPNIRICCPFSFLQNWLVLSIRV